MNVLKADVVVIGAGTAGMNAFNVLRSARVDALLVDRGPLGTTCARVGCMPSKAALYLAERWATARELASTAEALTQTPDDMWQQVRNIRDSLASGAAERARASAGERLLMGEARFVGPHALRVDSDTQIEARAFIMCTGSRPVIPSAFVPLADKILTTDTLFEQETLPPRIGVIGMGAVGLEMSVALARMGLEVIGADQLETVGGASDPEIQTQARAYFESLMPLWLGAPLSARADGESIVLVQGEHQAKVDRLLLAVGRQPNVEGLDLPAAGVALDARGVPQLASHSLAASPTGHFLAGDVNPQRPLMHEAVDEGVASAHEALAYLRSASPGTFNRRAAISIVFTEPDLCAVGASFDEATQRRAVIGEAKGTGNGRSRILGAMENLLRIYVEPQSGILLGASIFSIRGEHLAHLLAWAIQSKQTISDLLNMPFYHPSIEEMLQSALKDAALKMRS